MIFFLTAALCLIAGSVWAQGRDELYIMIDDSQLTRCPGGKVTATFLTEIFGRNESIMLTQSSLNYYKLRMDCFLPIISVNSFLYNPRSAVVKRFRSMLWRRQSKGESAEVFVKMDP